MEDGLVLHNSMGKRKETFSPRKDDRVRIFTCGPSIYARPHLGNYRTFLFEDILVRYLEYLGFHVERAMNLTDVEDKAIEMAEKEGISVGELTKRNEKRLLDEWDGLRLKRPDHIPRSSGSVEFSVKLIKKLLHNRIAYWHGDDVFYDPLRFESFGKLFGLDMSRWPKKKRRFGKDTYPGTQWNLGDFILWHGCSDEERVCWDEELGSGRPSWNVQDPAMCWETLGPEIDIWCGGWDNLWRHHDYNIAVMEGAHGVELAPYWLHGGHLLLNGKKMSKSKGNILYPEDMEERGYTLDHLRFYMLYGPYRRRRNMTMERSADAAGKLDSLRDMISSLEGADRSRSYKRARRYIDELEPVFRERMNDDLDVKGAFDAVSDRVRRLYRISTRHGLTEDDRLRALRALERIDEVFQFIFPDDG